MKKNMIAICVLSIGLICPGCGMNQGNSAPSSTKQIPFENQNDIAEKDVVTEENTVIEENVVTEKNDEVAPNLPTNNIYVNEKFGYQFEFPESWLGWYFVNDENPEIATVRFYGKSNSGTVLEKELFGGDYGLTMFYILSEEEASRDIYGNVQKIGTAQGKSYYFGTTTDVSLAPLISGGNDVTDEEKALAKEDWEKAKEMMTFYNSDNIDNLTNAFSEN